MHRIDGGFLAAWRYFKTKMRRSVAERMFAFRTQLWRNKERELGGEAGVRTQ